MKGTILKVLSIVMASIFLLSALIVLSDAGSNSNILGNHFKNDLVPFVDGGTNATGYVKCTIDLFNNTKYMGNYVNESQKLCPKFSVFDPANGYIYITTEGSTDKVLVFDTYSDCVIKNITVGSSPNGLAYDALNGNIYVVNTYSSNVSVIDTATNTVIKSIYVAPFICNIVSDSNNGNLYVTSSYSNSVEVLNASTNSVTSNISVGVGPIGITFDPSNNDIYVGYVNSPNISVISIQTSSIVKNITLTSPVNNGFITFDPLNDYIYVNDASCLSVINGSSNNIVKSFYCDLNDRGVTVDTITGNIYMTYASNNEVSVLNGVSNTLIKNIKVACSPMGIVFDSYNDYIYVNNELSSSITVISVNATPSEAINPSGTVKYTLDLVTNQLLNGNVGVNSASIKGVSEVFDPDSGNLYVTTGETSDNILVINDTTNTIVREIPVGYGETGITFDSANNTIYAVNDNSCNISLISGTTDQFIKNISVPSVTPCFNGIVYDPSNEYLYITSGYTNGGLSNSSVYVVNTKTNSFVGNITVGKDATGILYDPSNSLIYVSNAGSASLSIIDPSLEYVLKTISVPGGPGALAFDPTYKNVYVAHSGRGSNNVTIVNDLNNAVIGEINLYSLNHYGIAYDSANGYIYVGDSTTGNISVINVTSYNIVTNISLKLDEPGSVLFDSLNNYVYVTNSKYSAVNIIATSAQVNTKYKVTFNESGLSSGLVWYVNLTDGINSGGISGSSYSFFLANNSYDYSISPPSGYTSTPSSGIFVVEGFNKTINVTFAPSAPNEPPAWAFIGSYINYTLTEKSNNTTHNGYIYFRISSINNATKSIELDMIENNGSSVTSSYYNVSWNDAPFAFNSSILSELNNGTVPNILKGYQLTDGLVISTPLGSFTTDKLSTTAGSSPFVSIYVDSYTGVVVSDYLSNNTVKLWANISSTNIPAMNKVTKRTSGFPTETYEIIGIVAAAIAVVSVSVFAVRKKR